MGWKDINLNLLQGFEFSVNAQDLILCVFDRANEALDDQLKKYMESFDKQMSKPMEESEADVAFSEKDWEQELHRQRMQGIGVPVMVLGASQEQSVSFEPFRECLTKATFEHVRKGSLTLRFESMVAYSDVFGASHTTRDVGVFDHSTMRFRIEEHTAG